ncbi:MAG: hypothetical protein LBB16_01775 [Puniceicoccales bacterium]|jgi:hypothetical protein|nr:hypothetical protein [Puniceicoccales bacterium]
MVNISENIQATSFSGTQGTTPQSHITAADPNGAIARALKKDFGLKLSNTNLGDRSVAPASPRKGESTSAELLGQIGELKEKKYEVGAFTKFFIALKTLFRGRGSYKREVAEQAFRNIGHDKQTFCVLPSRILCLQGI